MKTNRVVKFAVMFALVGISAGLVSGSNAVVVSNVENGLISKPVATQLNSPVLNVGKDYVPRPTSKAIKKIGAREVIIIGGENEVSARVERKLEKKAGSVTRIGENNNIDTSISVSRRFWQEGSEQVTIVQDGSENPVITASVQNSIRSRSGPVLISGSGPLEQPVISEVERLNPRQATVYAHNPQNVEKQLQEAGVENVRVVRKDQAGTDYEERIGEGATQILVMPSDSEVGLNAISSGSHSEGVVVQSRADINRLVGVANQNGVRKVVVAGDSQLARAAVVAFRTGTDMKVEKEYESSSATAKVAFED